ncbi:MAG: DnaJ domain-containing protein [Chitinophagales bacterium]
MVFSFNKLFNSLSKIIADEETAQKETLNPTQKSHAQEIENAVLVLAAEVIRCDKNLTADTEKHIKDYLVKQFGISSENKRLKALINHIETGTEPFSKISCKELKLLTTYDSRLNIINFLFGVANADDFLNAKEAKCIHRIGVYLGINENDFRTLKRSFLSENNPYKILEIDEEVSFEQVKTAYRKMVLKYHPDKREEGTDIDEANHKFREIQRAFEKIKEQRNID